MEDKSHRAILRLQGLDALGDITIIDVVTVDIHEVVQGGRLVAGGFLSRSQFVVEGNAGFAIDAGSVESLFIPADGGLGHYFFEEALRQPVVSLHD